MRRKLILDCPKDIECCESLERSIKSQREHNLATLKEKIKDLRINPSDYHIPEISDLGEFFENGMWLTRIEVVIEKKPRFDVGLGLTLDMYLDGLFELHNANRYGHQAI